MSDEGPEWVLEYLELRERRGSAGFRDAWLARAAVWWRRYRHLMPVLPSLDAALGGLRTSRGSGPRVAFLANRFVGLAHAARGAGLDTTILATNHREVVSSTRARLPFGSLFTVAGHVNAAALAATTTTRRRRIELAVEHASRSLRRASPDVVVVPNDSLPLPRVVVSAARRAGVHVVCIQDGVYLPSDHPDDLHGYSSDIVLIWGEFFGRLFNRSRRPSMQVFGYPHPISPGVLRPSAPGARHTVCFVGQPYESYDRSLEPHKLEIVHRAVQAAERVGMSIVYRPHQGESAETRRKIATLVALTPKYERLDTALSRYAAFIGINSTVLIQAGVHGKPAAQLRHHAFGDDDFAAYGASASVDANDVSDVARFLRSIDDGTRPPYPRASFVKVLDDLGGSFREWIEEFVGVRHA